MKIYYICWGEVVKGDLQTLPVLRYGVWFSKVNAVKKTNGLNADLEKIRAKMHDNRDTCSYFVKELDVNDAPNFDEWLDTLNYWDDDVREASERQDAEPRYDDYNKVIDEIYNLKIGE